MDLTIITVTHNDKNKLAEQIKSVPEGALNISYEQWIVDNASSDGTVEYIREYFSHIKLISNKENAGFGNANNQAAALAQGEFLLFLNPDMRLEPDSLEKIVSWMRQRSEVGIVSCKLVTEDGRFNEEAKPRRFPKVFDQLVILLKLHHLFPSVLKNYLYCDFDPDKEQEVDSVRGSFMLMRRSLVEKLGWAFDPRYFIWFEDVDICRECKKNKMKVVYTPLIRCVDYVGQSFKKMPVLWKQKNFTKSMLQYFKKWEPWYKWIWIAIFRPVGIFLVIIFSR